MEEHVICPICGETLFIGDIESCTNGYDRLKHHMNFLHPHDTPTEISLEDY